MNEHILVSIEEFENAKKYWFEKLSGDLSEIKLPEDSSNHTRTDGKQEIALEFPAEVSARLMQISKKMDLSLYVVLLAAWKVFLYKYTGQEDLSVTSPIYTDVEEIYNYNKCVVFRDILTDEMTMKDTLIKVKDTVTNGYENQYYPLSRVLELLEMEAEPLHKVIFLLENIHEKARISDIVNLTANLLTVQLRREEETVHGMMVYEASRLEEATVREMCDAYIYVLEQVLTNINIPLKDVELVSAGKKLKMAAEFSCTSAQGFKKQVIHELFVEQVEKTPEQIAIVYAGCEYTYRELNEAANKLARVLRRSGVKPEEIIALVMESSFEMAVGILGVLKAGTAYLPINPEYPAERIEYILQESAARSVVTQAKLSAVLTFAGEKVIIEECLSATESAENLECVNSGNDLAYVIYTSGTTGMPKGICVEHGSLSDTIQWRRAEYELNTADRVLQLFSYSFDGFITSFFTPLISGATVVLLSDADGKNALMIRETLVAQKITHFIAVPSLYWAILDSLTPEDTRFLRIVTLAGEKVTPKIIARSRELNSEIELINEYGPTEGCVVATIFRHMEKSTRITIGRPVGETEIYIVNHHGQLQPIGAMGELCISSSRLARGYLLKPDLTSEKFIANSFSLGKCLYKTGDMARWLPDGNIELAGRIDRQVKVRGYRIELDEIERQLLRHPAIKEAAVLERERMEGNDAETELIAYFVAAENLDVNAIRNFLSNTLPGYMIPAHLLQIEHMPLTPAGKIDFKNLRTLAVKVNTAVEYQEPTNELERRLQSIWAEVLGLETIGIKHNFFDFGGHSLKATILVTRLQKEFNVQVPLTQIFKTPTIKELAKCIEESTKIVHKSIEAQEKQEYYPLSSAQKRLYILDQFKAGVSYNSPGALLLEGAVDREKIQAILQALVSRHETFRTSFEMRNGEPVQIIHDHVDFLLEDVALSHGKMVGNSDAEVNALGKESGALDKEADELDKESGALGKEASELDKESGALGKEADVLDKESDALNKEAGILDKEVDTPDTVEVEKAIRQFIRPFDLSKPPLLRAGLTPLSEDQQVLVFDMHHIVADGFSVVMLQKEFVDRYAGRELSPLRIQYKDFAVWQNKVMSETAKKDEEYWLAQFKDLPVTRDLPTDFPRTGGEGYSGDSIEFDISKDLFTAITSTLQATGMTLSIFTLGALHILLSKYTGGDDNNVGMTIAGRYHSDLTDIIGMFVNVLVMRNRPCGDKTVAEFLQEVKDNALQAYEHQEYQFEQLVEKLNIERNAAQNPLFDVCFNAINTGTYSFADCTDLQIRPYSFKTDTTKFDLVFNLFESEAKIQFRIEFKTALFQRATVERMKDHYLEILAGMCGDKNIHLDQINISSNVLVPNSLVEADGDFSF